MLSDADQDRLVEMLVATAEVMGEQIRPAAAAYMVADLATYPLPVLANALTACRREVKGKLSLAAIMERIDDGHPAPNEAWAVAIRAADEAVNAQWNALRQDDERVLADLAARGLVLRTIADTAAWRERLAPMARRFEREHPGVIASLLE
jgi:hypothetical protein